MRYKNILNEVDYDLKNRELHKKIDDGEKITRDEEAFVCHCLKFDNLLLHPFCIDEYFSRCFLFRTSDTPPGMHPLKERDHIYYEGLVREWEVEINKTNHSNQLLQIVSKETRDELRNLRKRYSIFHRAFSSTDYNARKFRLLEWSKYRYIMIKDVFELSIKSDKYILYLNENEIVFDYYSLTHILTRHFGHIMKTYETDKSHFTKDIHHEEVHLKLEEIFKKIDSSKYFQGESVLEINFRYNGTIYKIFCDYEHVGSKKRLRLNSFFPTESEKMLERLKNDFLEKVIDGNLSIFVKKAVTEKERLSSIS